MKHVLMGTSSNFGNIFSPAGASIFVAFLPMPPSPRGCVPGRTWIQGNPSDAVPPQMPPCPVSSPKDRHAARAARQTALAALS
jgi:hypothetical protein